MLRESLIWPHEHKVGMHKHIVDLMLMDSWCGKKRLAEAREKETENSSIAISDDKARG